MKVGKEAKVSNPNQINYPLKGVVIESENEPSGMVMSKVKFSKFTEVWYEDKDLEESE